MLLIRSSQAVRLSLAAVATLLLTFAPLTLAQDAREAWNDLPVGSMQVTVDRASAPETFRALSVDFDSFASHLATAPQEQTPGRVDNGILVSLPLPDGEFATYRVVESPVMQSGIQARYPNIRTYLGHEIDSRRSTVRLSVTPQGIHAMGFHPEGTFYVDPIAQHEINTAMSYWREALPARDPELFPHDEVEPAVEGFDGIMDDDGIRFDHGSTLRTYRIAIGTTYGYTNFHSTGAANVEDALAALVVAMNRVNSIYEREITVRMIIVDNNDEVIFTTPTDDPYPSGISGTLLNVNQQTLDTIIGSANYDIGHVFTTSGGGLAQLNAVCTAGKARGATGLAQPVNDPFTVDYVSHEIGHQFGANHVFNSSYEPQPNQGCLPHRRAPTAVEPGSGSTIMAYSGLCGPHNIQISADDYFNNISITEMITFIVGGAGGGCASQTATGNPALEVSVESGPQLPILTPFVLTGDYEYDGDDSDLTFGWEGRNTGPASPPPGIPGWNNTAPFFRSFQPIAEPTRFFPRLDRVLLNQPHIGEGLPDISRIMNFRLTARNNAPGGGAVTEARLLVPVSANAGPFVVTSQNTVSTTIWHAESEQVVTWDVAGTDSDTYGGENVDILLSTDRHHDMVDGSYIVLAESVPNTGSATITVPADLESNRGRVFVKAADGFFFGYNTRDINLLPTVSTDEQAQRGEISMSAVYPNPLGVAGSRGTVNLSVERSQDVTVAVYDALGRLVMTLHEGPVSAGANHQFAVQAGGLAAGAYFVRAIGESFSEVRQMTVVH